MPYRRKRRTTRRPRRRMYRKKWSRSNGAKNRDGRSLVKLRVVTTVSSDAGGQISSWLNDDVSGYQDWTSFAAVYDSFRVCALKLKFVPDLPNDTSTITGYKPLYVVHDVDQSNIPTLTVNDAIQYENCQIKNMYRPWAYFRRFRKQTTGGVASQVIMAGGYKDVALTTASQCIQYIGTGFDISTTYGTIISTAYVSFKNRR